MNLQPIDARTAAALVGGLPLSYKSYPDGSLVVIAPSGQKMHFTPEQVAAAHEAVVVRAKRSTTAQQGPPAKKPAAQPGGTK